LIAADAAEESAAFVFLPCRLFMCERFYVGTAAPGRPPGNARLQSYE